VPDIDYSKRHVDYLAQGSEANEAWATFILDRGQGFTRPGVERLNDSIRTYVWAILGSQAQTRSNILGSGSAFAAQQQFLSNVEDAIESPVDIPMAISCYESILQNARSEVDYVLGEGLYMIPHDMELRVSPITDYVGKVVLAPGGLPLGVVAQTAENTVEMPTTTQEKVEGQRHRDQVTSLIIAGITVGMGLIWVAHRAR
jgi:hypothetical protein